MCINVILLDTIGQVISHLFFSSQENVLILEEPHLLLCYEFTVANRGKRGLSMLFLDPSLRMRIPYIYCLKLLLVFGEKTHPLITRILAKRESCITKKY